jgi:hypothetical protein
VKSRRLPFVVLVASIFVLVLAQAGSTASPPPPVPSPPSCSPAPADCGAWHTANVTASWPAPPAGVHVAGGCGATTLGTDGAVGVSCTWANADNSIAITRSAVVRRDASPPTAVTATADRGPDASGWYNHPLKITFSGTDATSGISSCTSGTFSGPDTAHTAVPGSCTDNAGNVKSTGFELKYDATPPTVIAKPDRRPNAHGWYNHALTVSFVGSDPTSGIASCVAPFQYKGPDNPNAMVTGTCTDNAANTSKPAQYQVKFDTKPPRLARVAAVLGSRGVALRWTASKDSVSFEVVRRPGLRGRRPSTLYHGPKRSFVDHRVQSGVKYHYTVTAYDEAGNAAVKALLAQPKESGDQKAPAKAGGKSATQQPALLQPSEGAHVSFPPQLTWRAVSGATYYNVQLYRNGHKVMSAWPRGESLVLQKHWTYRGQRYVLSPGRYRWYVWPGFGSRSSNRYGKLIGTRSFLVTR